MRDTVCIICEYNPFHNGHMYQINKIREKYKDANIIAIMSGNVTQRGEFAFADKYTRAKCAVKCGVNGVFEIPYPFCASNAEIYAKAGIYIAHALGANIICFGTENDDIGYLYDISKTLDTEEYEKELSKAVKNKKISFSSARAEALEKLGKKAPVQPNTILAIEYIRAIGKFGYDMQIFAIKREGADYNDTEKCKIMSAGGIRKHFYESGKLFSMPDEAIKILETEIKNGRFLDKEEANNFLYRYVVMQGVDKMKNLFDVPDGAEYFIKDLAKNSQNGNRFFEELNCKSYTYARLRRAVLYMLFDIRQMPQNPMYTQVLSADGCGREIIKNATKLNKIEIVNKVADYVNMTEKAREQFLISIKTDMIYNTLCKNPSPASEAFKRTPFIEK